MKLLTAVMVDIRPRGLNLNNGRQQKVPACADRGREGRREARSHAGVCAFALWRWRFVSSSFVFPWESVKYPGCCPDLGEGLRHPPQADAQVYIVAGLC